MRGNLQGSNLVVEESPHGKPVQRLITSAADAAVVHVSGHSHTQSFFASPEQMRGMSFSSPSSTTDLPLPSPPPPPPSPLPSVSFDFFHSSRSPSPFHPIRFASAPRDEVARDRGEGGQGRDGEKERRGNRMNGAGLEYNGS